MKVVGLTGSIGMGKTTAAALLRRLGVPVHEADAAVHRLMERGGAAVPAIERAFPGVVKDGAVDRAILGVRVFGNGKAMARLEGILHPLVREESARFPEPGSPPRRASGGARHSVVVRKRTRADMDASVVVTAPAFVQRARVLTRPGMTS
jgi:dephospho-CoA kinase